MANEVLWMLINTLLRITALSLVYKIFDRIHPAQNRLITWGLMVVSVLYGLAALLVIFLICHPLAAAWNASIHGSCGDQVVSYVALEIIGALIDLAILIAPLPHLICSQVQWRRKIVTAAWLSAGSLSVAKLRT